MSIYIFVGTGASNITVHKINRCPPELVSTNSTPYITALAGVDTSALSLISDKAQNSISHGSVKFSPFSYNCLNRLGKRCLRRILLLAVDRKFMWTRMSSDVM